MPSILATLFIVLVTLLVIATFIYLVVNIYRSTHDPKEREENHQAILELLRLRK